MLTLAEALAEHAAIRIICRKCGRNGNATIPDLIKRYGRDASVFGLARRMRCSECGTPADVFLWLDDTEAMRVARWARPPEIYAQRNIFWPDEKKRR